MISKDMRWKVSYAIILSSTGLFAITLLYAIQPFWAIILFLLYLIIFFSMGSKIVEKTKEEDVHKARLKNLIFYAIIVFTLFFCGSLLLVYLTRM